MSTNLEQLKQICNATDETTQSVFWQELIKTLHGLSFETCAL